MIFRTDSRTFTRAMSRVTDAHRAYLSPIRPRDLSRAIAFVHPSGLAGGIVARADDGTLEARAIFNAGAPKGTGRAILRTLAQHGATRLDCIGDGLRALYESEGWRVAQTLAWCDDYAPEGWDYARDGRPNVYVMNRIA